MKPRKRQLTTKTKKPPTERIIKDIRSLRDSGKTDIDIRETLGIELRIFQRYTKTIYEQDKQIWYDISSQEVESELLRLRSCLNYSYNIAKQLSEDSTLDCQDRLQCLQSMLDARLSMVQILREYDEFKTQRKIPLSQPDEETISQSAYTANSTLKRIH